MAQHGGEQLLLILEVGVDALLIHPGLLGNDIDPRAVKAFVGELL